MSGHWASPPPQIAPGGSINDYEFIRPIGKGGFSEVFLAVSNKSHAIVAIKKVEKENLRDEIDNEHFQREIMAMRVMEHPNIVKLLDNFEDEMNYYLVMDYCGGGNLLSYVNRSERLAENVASAIFSQIVDAISFTHSLKIAHRDLKLENILIEDFPLIKIADFGLCGIIEEKKLMKTFCGSPLYCSPETILNEMYDGRMSDIWGLGVILYCLVVGCLPWDLKNPASIPDQIVGVKISIPSFVSQGCSDLLKLMLRRNPSERATLGIIRNHFWLKIGNSLVARIRDSIPNEPECRTHCQLIGHDDDKGSHKQDAPKKAPIVPKPYIGFKDLCYRPKCCSSQKPSIAPIVKSKILVPETNKMTPRKKICFI